MYFVAKGECSVRVRDRVSIDGSDREIRKLYPGDHFGEIGLIYNCKRTATVIATNYSTMAALD